MWEVVHKKNLASTLKSYSRWSTLNKQELEEEEGVRISNDRENLEMNLYIRELLVIILMAYLCLNRTTLNNIIPMLLITKIVPQPVMKIHDLGFREGLTNALICDQNGKNCESNKAQKQQEQENQVKRQSKVDPAT